MELSKNYLPAAIEEKWNKHWNDKKYFNSYPDDRPAFTVVIPPPNVTGVLHMGHTLNETVQDILVRKARMSGFNACWVPGSDHASIATEARVVNMLKEKGIDKNNLSREEFLRYAFEWKEKYGGIIYNQIEKLGCSVDWNRATFTMDDHYYKAVIKVFINLYNKGLIYRGARMINWDPAAKTALSDEEVEYKDLQGKLYYLKYYLEENGKASSSYISIATQRPETIMGDTAICVNPDDNRYTHLRGAHAFVPLINRRIPVIFDEYVSPEFGTGALKVTPAHDINDYNLGLKYNLEVIDTLNEDGTMSPAAEIFVGEDRFVARKKIIATLKEQDFLLKEEEYPTRLGYSQRTGVVVEPRISTQWFVKMKEMAAPALKAVTEEKIFIHPEDKFLATYKYWMENVKDWCISRQLWWGQQIPAWYDLSGRFVVAADQEAAQKIYEATYLIADAVLTRDEDVLDTWFSSWLWPMEVFKGVSDPGNKEIKYYYPTAVLVTGQDIIFFWVARMIMAGMELEGEKPFSDVYFTGMVRDKLGRKMSKSLGNSPDLLELIDKYGADAVRFGIMISSPAGNDLLFDENSLGQGRNFNNKIWNALKLVKMWSDRKDADEVSADQHNSSSFAINWFENRLRQAGAEIDSLMQQFRLSEALKTLYSLIWDDFCSWYLEWVKPGIGQPVPVNVYHKTLEFFTSLMQLLHPYMPFITEEVYHLLEERKDDLCMKQFASLVPTKTDADTGIQLTEISKQLIQKLRDFRAKRNIKPSIKLFVVPFNTPYNSKDINDRINKLANAECLSTIKGIDGNPTKGDFIIVENYQFRIDLGELTQSFVKTVNVERRKELDRELEYLKGFLILIDKKLNNEKFVRNAKPELVKLESKKKADTEINIKLIEESLQNL